uniref:Si:ch211-214c7.5 n=1 Tax=Cyprinus carpio TaxID=7962 RepID=A0A8C1SP96_CYPCA
EAAQSLTEAVTSTQTFEGNSSSCQIKRMLDEKISPFERKLEYLLNKADEFQTQLLWSRECLQNYGFANIVTMFLQTCQLYFTYLGSTARNSNPFHPPLSTYLLQFSQQLCSRLEQLMLLYASFSFFSLEESDPLRYKPIIEADLEINVRIQSEDTESFFSTKGRFSEHMIGAEGNNYDSVRIRTALTDGIIYFLCCEDVFEAADDKDGEGMCEGEKRETERESTVERIWSIGRWVQTHPDPETEDITDFPCGQYKQLLCLGREEPSSCNATDYLLGVLLSQGTDGTFGMKT